MATFVDRFSELRDNHQISFSSLSKETGIALRTLKYYSSSEHEPSMSTLISLADYFDVSLDYLVGRSDNPKRI